MYCFQVFSSHPALQSSCCHCKSLAFFQDRCSFTIILINNQKLFSNLEKTYWNASLIKRRVKNSSLNLSHAVVLNQLDLWKSFKLFSELEKSSALPWNREGIQKPFSKSEKGY